MLFKEKVVLANCDSVRALAPEELRKRFLTGLAFADGVVLSPNSLIDNQQVTGVLTQPNVVKFLNEEGAGKLVIRGFGLQDQTSLIDYYQALPDNFILSSLPGSPCKSALSRTQQGEMTERLGELQRALEAIRPRIESLNLPAESLRDEVFKRLDTRASIGHFFESDGELQLFLLGARELHSRSAWYRYATDFFHLRGQGGFEPFRAEIIDPGYNALFALKDEGFLQDNIRFLSGVPEVLLDSSVALRSLRREIQLIQYPLKLFEFITSLGTGELARYLTDEALGYIEDKLTDKGHSFMTRRNWFGMYPRMRRYMGLEIK